MIKHSYKQQKVGHKIIRYLHKGKNGKPLVFSNAFGFSPHLYTEVIDELVNKGYEVVSPAIAGIYFANQPNTVKDCAEVIADFCDKIKLDEYYMAGHSTGGGIALLVGNYSSNVKKAIAFNPILLGKYTFFGLAKTQLVLSKEVKFLAGFLYNVARNPKAIKNTIVLTLDIARFNYNSFSVAVRSKILYGEKDEFGFNLDQRMEKELKEFNPNLEVKRFPDYGHMWPLHKPKEAVKEISDFLIR